MKQFLKMSYLDFKGHMGPFCIEEFLTLQTLYPFLSMAFYCLLAGYAYHTSDLTEWVIGNSFLLSTTTCIFTLGGAFTGERMTGRIRSIISSPSSKTMVVLEKGFFPCLVCVATTLIGFLAGAAVFGVSLKQVNWGLYILILICAMAGACSLGLFVSTFGLLTDQMHLILNTFSFIFMMFTGANFPVKQLPLAGRVFSQMLPLTRSIRAAKLLFQQAQTSKILALIGQEVLLAAVYFILASLMIRYAELKAVQKGTLDLF